MKIQLGQIGSIIAALNNVGNLDLPVKISYWFARTAKELQREAEPFEEQRLALLKKYAKLNEEGNLAFVENKATKQREAEFASPENREAFEEKFEELVQEEVEIKMDPLSIETLGDIDIKPAVMVGLLPLLKEE